MIEEFEDLPEDKEVLFYYSFDLVLWMQYLLGEAYARGMLIH